MSELDRRDFMNQPVLASSAFKLGKGKKSMNPLLFSKEITAKPLPFDPKKLKGLSEKLIISHWENNYGGSVKTLNILNKKLEDLWRFPQKVRKLAI